MSDKDAESLASYWKTQPSADMHSIDAHQEAPPFDEEEDDVESREESRQQGNDDPDEALVQQAIQLMRGQEWISASRFAREFKIGNTRAGRIMDILVARGLVSATANGPRNTRRVLLAFNEQSEEEQDEAEEVSLSS